MNNDNTRVLGRVLAVEETKAVSGAKNTTACSDNLTKVTIPASGDSSCDRGFL